MSNTRPNAPERTQPPASVSRRFGLETHPIYRAAFAAFVAKSQARGAVNAQAVAAELWPQDVRTARVLTRGAVDPMFTADHTALAQSTVGAFYSAIPQCAGANLIAAGLTIDMAPAAKVTLPFRSDSPAVAPFIGEDGVIPVREGALDAALFGPVKAAATIFAVSREVARQPGAEAVFRRILEEDAAVTLDSALFSDAAADDTRPAGLLYGVTPLAGYAGGDEIAMREDMKALAAAVADGGGTGALAIILHPKQAATLQLIAPNFPWQVWPSRVVPEGRVIALDPGAFAAGFGDSVDITTTATATLHMSTTPAEIVSSTGPTAADPVRALFQTDSVAVRLIVEIVFAMRGRAISYADGVTW